MRDEGGSSSCGAPRRDLHSIGGQALSARKGQQGGSASRPCFPCRYCQIVLWRRSQRRAALIRDRPRSCTEIGVGWRGRERVRRRWRDDHPEKAKAFPPRHRASLASGSPRPDARRFRMHPSCSRPLDRPIGLVLQSDGVPERMGRSRRQNVRQPRAGRSHSFGSIIQAS